MKLINSVNKGDVTIKSFEGKRKVRGERKWRAVKSTLATHTV